MVSMAWAADSLLTTSILSNTSVTPPSVPQGMSLTSST